MGSRSFQRVVIALTDTTSITEMWERAMQVIRGKHAELTVVFLHDESWQRAASLPFTREVSKVGGQSSDFTLRRAEQLLSVQASGLQENIETLARSAGLPVAFQVLPEADQAGVRTLISSEINIVIGPTVLARHPVFLELQSSEKEIVFVGPDDNETEGE